ncbi:amidohydrolase family protein [Roseivirga sp. E12]|uniref:amidohydrolase family protein n=1 Tax=Roseivirga sp. E12 TaxID=2819237 RepID=UPI001ABC51F0|nr:amidohydrolase family protein [Roseivirga sp. E12]MBO3697465.1 amidohydrolase family protein [Roseivirga sp. E12]
MDPIISTTPILINSPETIDERSFAIINTNVITMISNEVLEDQVLIVEDGIITALGNLGSVTIPTGLQVIDAKGIGYIIPGLMDMHYHRSTISDLFLFVANGVLTVREMWGSPGSLNIRNSIIDNDLDLPRIFAASPGMNGSGGPFEAFTPPVTTVADAVRLVRKYKRDGYDFIKVYNRLSSEIYEAIIAEAASEGIPVIGHVPFNVGPERVFQSGQTSTEHLIGFGLFASSRNSISRGSLEVDKVNQLADLSVSNNELWHVPTISVDALSFAQVARIKVSDEYELISDELRNTFETGFAKGNADYRQSEENHKIVLTTILNKGGNIMLGTDAGFGFIIPGFSIHDELAAFVEAGLSNYEALKMATINPATYLKIAEEVGTVEVGKKANLVMLESNPLENIEATKDRAGVVLKGKWISEKALRDELNN